MTQPMAIFLIIVVALVLIISFVVWRLRLEHRRYDEFVRVIEKQPAVAANSGGNTQRPPFRSRAERTVSLRRNANVRAQRFRVIES